MFNFPDRGFVGVDKPIVCRALHMYRFVRAKDGAVLEPTLDLGIHCRLGHVLANRSPCILLVVAEIFVADAMRLESLERPTFRFLKRTTVIQLCV